MKTYHDRTADVSARIRKIRGKRRFIASTSLLLAVLIAVTVLMVPFGEKPYSPDATYDDLIAKLESMISKIDESDYNLGALGTVAGVSGTSGRPTSAGVATGPIAPGNNGAGGDKEYVEVTDNQVDGVIESDIFKRTTEHIFYLLDNELSVFSIAGEDSELVSTFTIDTERMMEGMDGWGEFRYATVSEMYLSQDGSSITVMMNVNYKIKGTCTALVSLDVTDPANVMETNRIYVSGSYQSSRLVDGQILLMSAYSIRIDAVDFDDLSTFVPQVVTDNGVEFVAAEDILAPETLDNCTYTTVCMLDEKTLSVLDTAACLSYSQDVYVSRDKIFVARGYSERKDSENAYEIIERTVTEFVGISYAGGDLELLDTFALEGTIKDQYSMDEHDGILRVVTSTNTVYYEKYGGEHSTSIRFRETRTNVNLYCVDLADWEIAASVIAFAPNGEDAQSVRFDGEKAYVCTAEVITFTDPVYFFDLSDLDNITWTDTGTIDGYSSSLIQLQDGYLLGIGYGDASDQLKVEVYMEENGRVVSVCAYELFANFSEEYKSYFIDRENNLFGFAVKERYGRCMYLLLHFDGYQLNIMKQIPLDGDGVYLKTFRSCMVDDYLYVMGTGYETYRRPDPLEEFVVFAVEKIW